MPKATSNEMNIEKEPPVKKPRTAINVEDTTIFCNRSSKKLQYIYFDDTCGENKTCNINFHIRKKCPYSKFFWSVFNPNAGKCGPEKFKIRTLFTQCLSIRISKGRLLH